MNSRRRQRSIARNHIPPLPIPRGLKYPLGSRMHFGVVHPRLEVRGRPFSRIPGSHSRVNLRVLRPLTRAPQGERSPMQTPHGHPRVQGIFLSSRGYVPHGGPMVHHSKATGFPIPQGCCLALSVAQFSLLRFVRNPAMSRFSLPHPVAGPVPAPHPSSHVYSPPGRHQPSGPGPLDPPPSRDRFLLLARVPPIPSPFSFRAPVSRSQGAVVWPLPHPLPGPVTASRPAIRVHTPPGCQQPSGAGLLTVDRFVLFARVAPIPSPFLCAHVAFS